MTPGRDAETRLGYPLGDPLGDPSDDTDRQRPAWIETVPEAGAEGELADLYRRFGAPVAHILRASSLNPPVLRTHYELYRAIMYGPSPLSRVQREMIATVVSLLNQCHY
jgi:alkylhydroperoxidase family enzyme